MDNTRKAKRSFLLFVLWLLWMLVAAGCVLKYPDAEEHVWCDENLTDKAEIEECIKEVDRRLHNQWRREERERQRKNCRWPYGVWVEPPGACRKIDAF